MIIFPPYLFQDFHKHQEERKFLMTVSNPNTTVSLPYHFPTTHHSFFSQCSLFFLTFAHLRILSIFRDYPSLMIQGLFHIQILNHQAKGGIFTLGTTYLYQLVTEKQGKFTKKFHLQNTPAHVTLGNPSNIYCFTVIFTRICVRLHFSLLQYLSGGQKHIISIFFQTPTMLSTTQQSLFHQHNFG